MGVHPDTGTTGLVVLGDAPGRRPKTVWILRVDTALYRVPLEADILLAVAQFLTCRDQNLLADDVDAGDGLGDGVFYLQTGIHLYEEKLALFIQELKGAHPPVVDCPAGLGTTLAHRGTHLLIDARCWGLLQHFLVPPLH